MKQWAKRLLGYDTETTGIGPDARLLEFGAVLVEDGKIVTSWQILVEPDEVDWNSPSVKKALAVNKLELRDVQGRKTFAQEFCHIRSALMQSDVRCGHNVRFDGRILSNEFRRAVAKRQLKKDDIVGIKGVITLDTLGLDRYLNPDAKRHTLEHVAERWGVFNWQKHRAIGDADASIRILSAMSDHLPDSIEEVAKISKQQIVEWEEYWQKRNARTSNPANSQLDLGQK